MIKKNPKLTSEKKLIMLEDGTEAPGTSQLNKESYDIFYTQMTEALEACVSGKAIREIKNEK